MKKLYIIYDGRSIPWKYQPQEVKDLINRRAEVYGIHNAKQFQKAFFPGNTDCAVIFETDHSLRALVKQKGHYGAENSMCIYVYDIVDNSKSVPPKNNELINEKFVRLL